MSLDITGGTFLMGTNSAESFPQDGEGPVRRITLDAFAIAPYAVTNADFTVFVEETGYKTENEGA
ncbi:SUMF1/EgtB/PvdO family nonheme iron enzyme [Paenibacillus alkalitolerans]|uniref:SUMF1/EgtB/PvdO family nonheme iron enzyme n=1 Tax=Paenibacillus alkalitolerans TaxID=2799335 RepID=UPI0038991981